MSQQLAVRPEGANHQWRKNPPGELSIDPVADERLMWVTAWNLDKYVRCGVVGSARVSAGIHLRGQAHVDKERVRSQPLSRVGSRIGFWKLRLSGERTHTRNQQRQFLRVPRAFIARRRLM